MAESPLDWHSDGRGWPHADKSRFVEAGGLRWHVQDFGTGPAALLIHGTGAASHSWRALAPLLAPRHRLLIPDLPGHGFSGPLSRRPATLPRVAEALHELLRRLQVSPDIVVGHSAGAAIMTRLALDGRIEPRRLISINGALLPFGGAAGIFFPSAARLLAALPLAARTFAWAARDPAAVRRLIASTGSHIDADGVALYTMLVSRARHVDGALQMMAGWDLRPLAADLPGLRVPLRLLAAQRDLTVPPSEASRIQALVPHAELHPLRGVGHLAHEEDPRQVAGLIAA